MPGGGVLAISTGIAELDEDHVSAHGYGVPGRFACLTFSDSGIGMVAETRQRIFEPFFTTKEVGKGTGLGLSIAYGIIKQHNGYINVYSEPGKGTSFRIYLPLVKAQAAELKVEEPEPVRGGSETILLAEDEPEVREITQKMLAEFGYNVITVVDGEEAVAKFRERMGEIDLAILDMVMPRKGGPEVYREIKGLSPGVKVVFTSGYAEEMVREIRGFRLLQGYRGHPPADLEAIQTVLLRLSRLVEEIPEIIELDLNPIFALPPGQGCRIADARIRVEAHESRQ